jgi:hypothetical protein
MVGGRLEWLLTVWHPSTAVGDLKTLQHGFILIQENFDKRDKKTQITFPLRHFFPLKVVK